MLEEIGLAYRLHSLPFPPRLLAPEYLDLNPLGTIPLFIDGDTTMTESAAILEYLSMRYASPALRVEPEDPAYGAWLNWHHVGEATLTTPQTVALRYGLFRPEAERDSVVQQDYIDVFLDKLRVVEAAVANREHLCADRFTSADISVAYAIMLAPYIGAEPRLPEAVKAYLARLKLRPGFVSAIAAQGG